MKTKQISVAEYLTAQLNLCGKSQIEVANEIGYQNPNVITMIKQGRTKLPISKVKLLAQALNVDPAYFLRMVMQEYMPETWEVIEDIFSHPPITAAESEILKLIREATSLPVYPKTPQQKIEFTEIVKTWGT